MKNIDIIGACSDLGVHVDGAKFGPEAIERNINLNNINNIYNVHAKEIKKDLQEDKNITEEEAVDIFGGLAEDTRKITKLANKSHREQPKNKYSILRISKTLKPVEYFCKMPHVNDPLVLVCDPMLATGGSAIDAVTIMKEKGFKNIRMLCLVGAPEGVEAFLKVHPDVELYLAALDDKLNEKGYILPGLGDAGDRIFGTL